MEQQLVLAIQSLHLVLSRLHGEPEYWQGSNVTCHDVHVGWGLIRQTETLQVDMGLASWVPLSEAQRMLNSLAAARQPAGLRPLKHDPPSETRPNTTHCQASKILQFAAKRSALVSCHTDTFAGHPLPQQQLPQNALLMTHQISNSFKTCASQQPKFMTPAIPDSLADAAAGGPQPGDAAAGGGCSGEDLDFDRWQALELPMALCTACAACGAGVRRY